MDLLVLGGTIFVGRHFVEAAIAKGHKVTLLHRGQRGADLFPDIDRILADRDGGLDALGDRTWDAVVDCCGYVPRVVRQSAQALAGRADRYLFVSSLSAYEMTGDVGIDESAPLAKLEDPTVEQVTGESYGGLKALCEAEVQEAFGDGAIIVRPGIIIGPYDPTNRFTYWVDRISSENEVLVPEIMPQPTQLIDARDLGLWMLEVLESGPTGIYNAAGPDFPKTFGDMIDACHALNPSASLVFIPEGDLEKHDLKMWLELPLAVPTGSPSAAIFQVNNRKAIAAGMKFRSWKESAADVLEWVRGPLPKLTPSHGLDREKELAVLHLLSNA